MACALAQFWRQALYRLPSHLTSGRRLQLSHGRTIIHQGSVQTIQTSVCISQIDGNIAGAALLGRKTAEGRMAVAISSSMQTAPETAAAAAPKPVTRQPVDYTTLVASVAELNRDWIPSKVEQALQVDNFTVVLRIRTLESAAWLHISRHESGCHMAVGDAPVRGGASEAFSFGEQVHSQLRSLVLLGAHVPFPWERIVQLDFGQRIGEPPSRKVFFEATGRYSNIILTDGKNSVLTAAFQLGAKMSSMRAVRAGEMYASPPPPPGIPPDEAMGREEWCAMVQKVAEKLSEQRGREVLVTESLVRGWQGVSPSLAQELCLRSGLSTAATVNGLSEEQWQALHPEWLGWLQALREGSFRPCVCEETAAYSVLGSYKGTATAGSLHALLHGYYSNLQGGQQFGQILSSVRSAVKSALKRLNTKIAQLEKQMGSSGKNEEVQKLGDLLMANLHRCEPGMTSIDVEDWETGDIVTIPLDPQKSAVQVAESFYKKGGKMRRSVEQVAPLLKQSTEEISYLQEVELSVNQLGNYETENDLYTLLEIRDELVSGRYMRPPPESALENRGASKGRKAQKKGKAKGAVGSCREFVTPTSGLKVLAGRNNRQNDALSRAAADNDLWLHARGVPGSHVVIKVPAGSQVTAEDREFAASIAAFFSKAQSSSRVDVICVEASNVKRPSGAKPGQVVLLKEDVVVGRPENCPESASFR
eukprot:CAMPEP_0117698122 /NCGR_PEP_ID=MMETSP0804-20121206/29597_1 /TAXON_ID=1074897 /ORGANISM="Tetraselmis astigmatica, Strain CCMP880" /LENGTH=703 /DNA_ID=CAMNT_0005512425 /DNA_START=58 /DNA_END=2170 /DNA_ORIENTATION=+